MLDNTIFLWILSLVSTQRMHNETIHHLGTVKFKETSIHEIQIGYEKLPKDNMKPPPMIARPVPMSHGLPSLSINPVSESYIVCAPLTRFLGFIQQPDHFLPVFFFLPIFLTLFSIHVLNRSTTLTKQPNKNSPTSTDYTHYFLTF